MLKVTQMIEMSSRQFGRQGKLTNFKSKDQLKHLSCVTYKGNCSCGSNYIGETIRNSRARFTAHGELNGKSEPLKHLSIFQR